jgi:hypothetical protein
MAFDFDTVGDRMDEIDRSPAGHASAAHLVALLQRKRHAMVGGFSVWIASAAELRELNPERGAQGLGRHAPRSEAPGASAPR